MRDRYRLSNRRICAGSVESRTWSFGKPGFAPKVSAKTSGPRLEPPMPSSRTSLNPAPLTSSAKRLEVRDALQLLVDDAPASRAISPRRVSVHSEASAAHRRRTLPSLRQSSSAAWTVLVQLLGQLVAHRVELAAETPCGAFSAPRHRAGRRRRRRAAPHPRPSFAVTASDRNSGRRQRVHDRLGARQTSSSRLGRGLPWSR